MVKCNVWKQVTRTVNNVVRSNLFWRLVCNIECIHHWKELVCTQNLTENSCLLNKTYFYLTRRPDGHIIRRHLEFSGLGSYTTRAIGGECALCGIEVGVPSHEHFLTQHQAVTSSSRYTHTSLKSSVVFANPKCRVLTPNKNYNHTHNFLVVITVSVWFDWKRFSVKCLFNICFNTHVLSFSSLQPNLTTSLEPR